MFCQSKILIKIKSKTSAFFHHMHSLVCLCDEKREAMNRTLLELKEKKKIKKKEEVDEKKKEK